MGIVWSIFWVFLVFDSPEKHPRIEEAELKYIQTSLAGIGGKVRYEMALNKICLWFLGDLKLIVFHIVQSTKSIGPNCAIRNSVHIWLHEVADATKRNYTCINYIML